MHFAAEQRAAGLAVRTIANREQCLRELAEFVGWRTPPQLDTFDLVMFLDRPNRRTGQPLAPGTKQVERSYLQTAWRFMVDEGYTATDAARRLRKVKVPRRKARPLRLEHIAAMLAARIAQSTADLIAVAAMTGLRVGEVVRIRGEDVDRITWTLRSVRKGGVDMLIKLSSGMIELAKRMPTAGWWFPSDYPNAAFPTGGGHILMKSASTRISIVLRKVGIRDPKITGHSLRHFYACYLLANGAPIRVVQEMLGHASLATTQLYTEVTDEQIAEATELIPTIGRAVPEEPSGRLAA
jgi:integrase/recombinase XerD